MWNLTVLAHEGEEVLEMVGSSLSQIIRSNQIKFTLASVVALFILTILAIVFSKLKQKAPPVSVPAQVPTVPPITPVLTPIEPEPMVEEEESKGALWKTIIFSLMVLVILANSAYLVGSTLYVNAKSITGGPVHWHADFEVWYCGKEIELIDPVKPANKVGSPLLHEHNDKEIHVEEAVFVNQDVTLGAFFRVVGGDLHSGYLKFPTNSGVVEMRNGDICPDGSIATLQVFLYKAGSFNQQELADPENYLMTPEQKVPLGDCVIFEFGSRKDKTDKLCQSYKVSKEKHSAH